MTKPGIYKTMDEFLDEFFPDDPEARKRIEEGASILALLEEHAVLAGRPDVGDKYFVTVRELRTREDRVWPFAQIEAAADFVRRIDAMPGVMVTTYNFAWPSPGEPGGFSADESG